MTLQVILAAACLAAAGCADSASGALSAEAAKDSPTQMADLPSPSTAVGKTYAEGRKILIANGFHPSLNYESSVDEQPPFEEDGFPEAGSCRGNCVTTFYTDSGECWNVLVNLTDKITANNEGVIEQISPSSDCTNQSQVTNANVSEAQVQKPQKTTDSVTEAFDQDVLDSYIYVYRDMVNPATKYIRFSDLIEAISANPKITSLTPIEDADGNIGLRWKLQGSPAGGILFQFDDGEAFPSSYIQGSGAVPITTREEAYAATVALVTLSGER